MNGQARRPCPAWPGAAHQHVGVPHLRRPGWSGPRASVAARTTSGFAIIGDNGPDLDAWRGRLEDLGGGRTGAMPVSTG